MMLVLDAAVDKTAVMIGVVDLNVVTTFKHCIFRTVSRIEDRQR